MVTATAPHRFTRSPRVARPRVMALVLAIWGIADTTIVLSRPCMKKAVEMMRAMSVDFDIRRPSLVCSPRMGVGRRPHNGQGDASSAPTP